MVRVASYASDHSLRTFVLRRDEAEGEDDHGAARELVAATMALCEGWISPLAISAMVESCDPTDFYLVDRSAAPERPSWFLRRRALDERLFLSSDYRDPQERIAEVLSAEVVGGFVAEALAQPPPAAHLQVALASLSLNAVAVALPDEVELELRYPGGPLQPLLIREGARQLALGPDHGPAGPPLRLRATNDHGYTRIAVEVCWDLWLEHPAGRAQLRSALERVLSRAGRGWQLAQGEL